MNPRKVLFVVPGWPEASLWGRFRYKFPALGPLTLAGLTPAGFDVALADENLAPLPAEPDAGLVAISVMTPQAPRAYALADRLRARGHTVVLGGIHPTARPDEARAHADAVAVGEADDTWPLLLADYAAGRLRPRYSTEGHVTLGGRPPPRRELLADGPYVTRATIQLSRGCPHDCEYCSVTAFYGRRFRFHPLDEFVAEYAALPGRFVFIVDDNIVSHRPTARDLFERLRGQGKWWGSQAPITVADDEPLLDAMAASGCKSLFIGFESLSEENLRQMGKRFVTAERHAERIRRIQDRGIGILGSFIVGCDHDDESVFDALYRFITGTRLEAFLVSVLTPFPGTRLADRLEAEGRILTRDWSRYDMNTVVVRPAHMTPERLQERFNELHRALYGLGSIVRRTVKPRKNMIIFVPQNLGYRKAWRGLLGAGRG